jgi:hypothetical protein
MALASVAAQAQRDGDDGGGVGPLVIILTNHNDRHRHPYKHSILDLVSKRFFRFYHRNFPDTSDT